jgi:enamine deaminase RidA (YjgF/YER057c/UK114 family)
MNIAATKTYFAQNDPPRPKAWCLPDCSRRDPELEQPPVSTAVGVPELARPGTLVEIEAVAVL